MINVSNRFTMMALSISVVFLTNTLIGCVKEKQLNENLKNGSSTGNREVTDTSPIPSSDNKWWECERTCTCIDDPTPKYVLGDGPTKKEAKDKACAFCREPECINSGGAASRTGSRCYER